VIHASGNCPQASQTANMPHCPHCGPGVLHVGGPCPRVRAVEYYPDGRVKRVEYHDPVPLLPIRLEPAPKPEPSSLTIHTGGSTWLPTTPGVTSAADTLSLLLAGKAVRAQEARQDEDVRVWAVGLAGEVAGATD
jgi:hypothetical protein